jgi:hypothetical protein
MCLDIDEKRTKRVRRTLKEHGGKSIMWKVVRMGFVNSDHSILYDQDYKKGCVAKSNRCYLEMNSVEEAFDQIDRGIHVFTNKPKAKEYLARQKRVPFNRGAYLKIIPVTVSEKDFVAAGKVYDAVFMQVYVN